MNVTICSWNGSINKKTWKVKNEIIFFLSIQITITIQLIIKNSTNDAFIIDEEKDYWKRLTKEAIYSIISKSINTHDEINAAWIPILYKAKEQIQRKIQLNQENYNKYKITKGKEKQDGDSDTEID
jgi:hypothetical protein